MKLTGKKYPSIIIMYIVELETYVSGYIPYLSWYSSLMWMVDWVRCAVVVVLGAVLCLMLYKSVIVYFSIMEPVVMKILSIFFFCVRSAKHLDNWKARFRIVLHFLPPPHPNLFLMFLIFINSVLDGGGQRSSMPLYYSVVEIG